MDLKEALKKSIDVWGYLAEIGGDKEEITDMLYPGEEPCNDCFLCEVAECDEGTCINWLEDGKDPGKENTCINSISPYEKWSENETPENALKVCELLTRELERRSNNE